MASQFPNCAGFEAIPNAKLLVHEEQPEQVAVALLRFFLETAPLEEGH
jgi:pimeloyl-ACP methyl ester carboxylesterase